MILLNSQGYWAGAACTAADGSYEFPGDGGDQRRHAGTRRIVEQHPAVRSGGSAGWTDPDGAVVAAATCRSHAGTADLMSGRAPARETIGRVLKTGRATCTFVAPSAGSVLLDWYSQPTKSSKIARKGKPVLVAAGARRFASSGTFGVKIVLTAKGRARLKHAKRQKITMKAIFTPRGGPAVTATRTITLTR